MIQQYRAMIKDLFEFRNEVYNFSSVMLRLLVSKCIQLTLNKFYIYA